jgi:hypothetical protein
MIPKKLFKTLSTLHDHSFTHSPTRQKFTDETGNFDYPYFEVLWFLNNGYLVQEFDIKNLTHKFRLKDNLMTKRIMGNLSKSKKHY